MYQIWLAKYFLWNKIFNLNSLQIMTLISSCRKIQTRTVQNWIHFLLSSKIKPTLYSFFFVIYHIFKVEWHICSYPWMSHCTKINCQTSSMPQMPFHHLFWLDGKHAKQLFGWQEKSESKLIICHLNAFQNTNIILCVVKYWIELFQTYLGLNFLHKRCICG